MKVFNIISIIFLFLFACKSEENVGHLEVISVDVKSMNQISIDSLIESVNLIPLEINDSCLISNVDKINFHNDKFYILDRKLGSIFVYDKNGKFESKLSKMGRGAGEYVTLSDFDIKPGTNDVYVLDAMVDKLILFRDGEFVKEFFLEFGASKMVKFCFLNENKIVFENLRTTAEDSMKYHLVITDDKINLLSKELYYKKSSRSGITLSSKSPFCSLENIISYNPTYDKHIYHIDAEQITPEYLLDFGDNWIDEEYLLKPNLDFNRLMQDLKKSNSIYFLNIIESTKHIFIYFTFKDERYAYLYNKILKKGDFIKDYMNDACGFNGLPLLSNEDSFIGLVNPYEMSNINEKEIQKLYPKSEDIDLGYNYILSFIKFK